MDAILSISALILAVVAALIHVGIFVLESVLWSRPAVWRRFGLRSQAEADVVRPMAYNQGFYNLFLALGVGAGFAVMIWNDATGSAYGMGGLFIMEFALACMVLASIVLLTTNRRFWQAALVQGAAALLAFVILITVLAPPIGTPTG